MHGEYTPLMKAGLLQKRLESGKARIDPEMGLEKFCTCCNDYWPQDTAFWSANNHPRSQDGLQHYCKACEQEGWMQRRSKRHGTDPLPAQDGELRQSQYAVLRKAPPQRHDQSQAA
ncbi:hypothetical protein [Aeromonas sp. L_1B5_3]|uniref:hypothetical protein n=1 Tax=Aeromonas sp. L_1B5_3 TaxID=1588629 RepID=UPI0018CD6093|nr:hypothetical protein [Aeromonas sp. L_1B5_3]